MTRRVLLAGLFSGVASRLPAADPPFYSDKQNLLFYSQGGQLKPVASEADWEQRRADIVRNMELVMGPYPREDRPAVDMQVLAETRQPGYVRKTISFIAKPGDRVPAYLMIPDRPNGRAVLALHPTGAIGKGIPAGLGPLPHRAYGDELARRGYVVLCPDYCYMGDPQKTPYELGYLSGTMKGIYNHSRGVDLLTSLPQVDANKVGSIGHSLGGHNSLFVAVFEPRVRAVVTSCGFNAFAKYYGGDLTGWSSDKYMPRIASEYAKDPARMPFDFTELLAAIAPRPVYISAPLHDANFEVSGVKDCVMAARPVYEKVYGLKGMPVAVHPDCEHDFPDEIRAAAYSFLDERLG